ncbi:MAG: helix-turn-helix domain-containing protein [Acidimicrobiales bacterium]
MSVGSGKRRRQPKFDTLPNAVAYRAAALAVPKTDPPLEKDEFLRSNRTATDGVRLRSISLEGFLDTMGKVLSSNQKRESGIKTAIEVFKRFFKAERYLAKAATTVDRKVAVELRDWLHAENCTRRTQGEWLRIARALWIEGQQHRYVIDNPFEQLHAKKADLPRFDRMGRDRTREEAPPWTATQLVAIARCLRPAYVLAFWICVLVGNRRSEGFGIRLRDWVAKRPWLSIEHQRIASPDKGASSPKTPDGERRLPMPPSLAKAIDRYIAEVHGPEPVDAREREAWLDRYLLVGVQGGPMNPSSLCDNVRDACEALGLDRLGRFQPLHHLRKTAGTLLQGALGVLRGAAVSHWLGHKVGMPEGTAPASSMTRGPYNLVKTDDVEKIADFLEGWLRDEVFPMLGSDDLLDVCPIDDGISIEETTRRLSCTGSITTATDVLELVQCGVLRAAHVDHTGPIEHQLMLISAADVDELLNERLLAAASTYNASEVAELLLTDHRGVYRLAEQGLIREVTINPRARRARHGNRGGALHGGGRHFERVGVDSLVARWEDRLYKLRHWYTIGEAAELLGCSAGTVRRSADRGTLEMWRDEGSFRFERLISPESVERALKDRDITIAEAAQRIGESRIVIRAFLKHGDLTRGSRDGTVTFASAERLCERLRNPDLLA